MSKLPSPFRIDCAVAGFTIVLVGLFAACENDTGPGPVPSNIEIVSGDGQYSKQGTELEEPIVAQVTLSDGTPAAGFAVRFVVRSGGGTVSRSQAAADSYGRASVRWTLGPTLGTQELTIESVDDGQVETVAQATSANFHCLEEDPTFVQRFTPTNSLFLFTKKSSIIAGSGPDRAGVVQLVVDTGQLKFDATSFVGFDETSGLIAVVRDCAFSASGEFYVSWTNTSGRREIAKINPNRSVEHFATLPSTIGAEITTLEGGVLAGCDEFGPFTVGCRDTLTRYDDATFDGTTANQANNDAVAYDKDGKFLYFIDETGRRLKRVPLDGYTQTGATVETATLTADEATGANGMVVHNGTVYILVETAATKSIIAVTSAGVKSTPFDFTSRGSGDAAGIQNDLALFVQGGLVALYTLDTLNNVIVLCQVSPPQQIFEVDPDASSTDPGAASKVTSSGERVGLAILP